MAQVVYMPFPSVEPRATPPNDYQNIPTRPQEFGAQIGQGEEQLGGGATKAGEFYGQVAADDATNKYMTASRNILFGDPTKTGPDGHPDRGFYGLQGRAAMDAQAGVAAQLETLRTQIGGGLMTPASRLQFESESRRFQERQSEQIGLHANTQAEHWYNEVEKSSIDVNRANLNDAVSRNDAEGIKHASADLVGSYERHASRISGNDPSVIRAATVDGKRDAATTHVMALAPKDPVAAGIALEGYRGDLGAAEYEKLHNQLKGPMDGAVANAALQRARGGGGAGPRGPAAVTTPQVSAAAQSAGVDPALANATAEIESGHGANVGQGEHAAVRGNIFQMGPTERASVGGGATMGSAGEQVQQGVQFLAKKREEMTSSLGRAPSNAEIYLAHQQGTAGATKLLSHPDQRAGDLVGDAAIRDNGGDPNAPARDFTSKWQGIYNQTETKYRDAGNIRLAANVPGPHAPGVADIADAQANLATNFGNTIAGLNNDPALDANPDAKSKAIQKAELDYRSHEMILTGQAKALTEGRNIAADGYVQRMMKGPIDGGILNEIANDSSLDRETRENLWHAYDAHVKSSVGGDTIKYGPRFFEYYQRIHADDNDPNKIRDPSQIFALANPKADGSQDVTLAGVEKLTAALKAPTAAKVGQQKIQAGAMAYAKHKLSLEADYGYYKVRDPKGEDAFNIGFIPAFFDYWEKGIEANKTPQQLVAKDEIDKLIAPFKRSDSEMMKDQLEAGVEVPSPPTAKATKPEDLANMDQGALVAAVRSNPALRSQAEALAIKKGWIQAPLAPPIAGSQGGAHLLPQFNDLGQTRPLGPGEWVQNPGGSWSNEITASVKDDHLNGGKPTVVPTLWIKNGRPAKVSEDEATELAAKSGLKFPSFADMPAAEKFANAREANWQKIKPEQSASVPSLWSR